MKIFLPLAILFLIVFTRLVFLLILLFFWIRGAIFLDPDFGWHIKSGELMLQHGIPKTDPFSYTMSSFPFINHEWLTDIFIALLYLHIGMIGLSLLASLAIVLALYAAVKSQLRPWTNIALLLTASSLFIFSGVRPQIISWIGILLLTSILFSKVRLNKWRWWIPILFLAWANLHGGFLAGIAILLVVIATNSLLQKKLKTSDVIIVLLSIAGTLINPYGIALWERILSEMWRQATDPQLRYVIMEWKTSLLHLDPSLWILIALSTFLLYRYKRIFTFSELSVFILLLLAGLSSVRHIPLWAIIQLPIFNRTLSAFRKEATKYPHGAKRFDFANRVVLFIVLLLFIGEGLWSLQQAWGLSEFKFYPKDAIAYLRANPSRSAGQLFSHYRWGGYLIWKYPEKKVFIDGRMVSWKQDKAPEFQSDNAFSEYKSILAGKTSFVQTLTKYQIDTVLFPKDEVYKKSPNCLVSIQTMFDCLIGNKTEGKEESLFIQQLRCTNLEKVYEDEIAVIYRKVQKK